MEQKRRLIRTLTTAAVMGVIWTALVFSDDEKLALDKLPKAVVDAIKAKFSAAELVEAEKEMDDGRPVYEVDLKIQGQKLSVKLAENGGILEVEKEVAAKDLPKAVSDAINAKFQGAKITEAEEVTEVKYEVKITTADGKTREVVYDASGHQDDDDDEDDDKQKK